MTIKKVGVVGGGSFGTVIANIIARNGHQVQLWMRDPEQVENLNQTRVNAVYLPGHELHPSILAVHELQSVVEGADLIFVAVPSSSFRSVVQQLSPLLPTGVIMITATKGIEAKTFHLMSQILAEEVPTARIGVLSGPNLAKEIVALSPTGTVIASSDAEVRHIVQETLRSDTFRVYANDDMLGVELGG
jgi:glycerol-3-phosphate dehydrogenase (NAD(P)+)